MRGYLWLVRRTTSGRSCSSRRATSRFCGHRRARRVGLHGADPGQLYPARGREPDLAVGRTPARVAAGGHRYRDAADAPTIIEDIEGVDNVFVLGGASPTGDRDVRLAAVTVTLDRLDHSLLLKLSELGRRMPLVGPDPAVDEHGP